MFIKRGFIIYLRLVCRRFLVARRDRFLPVASAFFNAAYDFSNSVGSLGRIAAATAARCACCAGVKLLKFIFFGAPFGATITGSGDFDAPTCPASPCAACIFSIFAYVCAVSGISRMCY